MKKWQKHRTNLIKPLPEMFIFYTFLNGLDLSYNAKKNKYFSSYSKAMKDKNREMV